MTLQKLHDRSWSCVMPSEQFADLSWCEQVTIWKDAVIVCFPLVIHTTLDSNHVGSLYKVSTDRHIWKATLVDILSNAIRLLSQCNAKICNCNSITIILNCGFYVCKIVLICILQLIFSVMQHGIIVPRYRHFKPLGHIPELWPLFYWSNKL
jgi:hypothetical protein